MKRATTMLGALALMTAGFLFAAPAAHATVTCTNVSGGSGSWPYAGTGRSQYCGTASSSNGSGMAGTLNSIQGTKAQHAGAQLVSNNAKFMIFKNKSEYLTWFGEPGNNPDGAPTPTVLDEDTGYTHFVSGVTLPRYSVVFVQAKWNDGTTRNVQINYATAKETGYWFSRFYSGLLSSSSGKAPDGDVFTNNLRIDWLYLNSTTGYIAPSSGFLPCQLPGNVFSGKLDFYGNAICSGSSLTGTYSGYANIQQVLQAAHPEGFTTNEQIFVEEVAERMGYSDQAGNRSLYGYFQNAQFECTRNAVQSIIKYGALIGEASSPSGLKGNQFCYSERTSSTGKKFYLYGVEKTFVTDVVAAYDSIPSPVRARLATAGYETSLAWNPDVLRDLMAGYPYTPADHNALRTHAAATEHTFDKQFFFTRYFNPTEVSYLATNKLAGTIAHESEHIINEVLSDPANTDSTFGSSYSSGIAAIIAAPSSSTRTALLQNFNTSLGKLELFAEIGAYSDLSEISSKAYSYSDLQTYFPGAITRFNAQRSAGNW